jgi:hypothetical protein
MAKKCKEQMDHIVIVVIAIVVGKRIITIMNVNTKNDELNMVNITIPI